MYILHRFTFSSSHLHTGQNDVLVRLGFLREFIQSTSGLELSKIDELPPQHAIVELLGDGRQTITQPHPSLLLRLLRKQETHESRWSG